MNRARYKAPKKQNKFLSSVFILLEVKLEILVVLHLLIKNIVSCLIWKAFTLFTLFVNYGKLNVKSEFKVRLASLVSIVLGHQPICRMDKYFDIQLFSFVFSYVLCYTGFLVGCKLVRNEGSQQQQ